MALLGEPRTHPPLGVTIPLGETLFTQSKNPKVRFIQLALQTIRGIATRSMSPKHGIMVRAIAKELEEDIETAIGEHLRAENIGGQEQRDKALDKGIIDAINKAILKIKEGGPDLGDTLNIILKAYDSVLAQGIIAVMKTPPTRIEAIMLDYQTYDASMNAFERSTDQRVVLLRKNLETIFIAIDTWMLHRDSALNESITEEQSSARSTAYQLIHDMRFEIGKIVTSGITREESSYQIGKAIDGIVRDIETIDIIGNQVAKDSLIGLLRDPTHIKSADQGGPDNMVMAEYWIGTYPEGNNKGDNPSDFSIPYKSPLWR